MKIETKNLVGYTLPVYKKYPNQTNPQQAFIEIELESGEVRADYNPEIGNAVPEYYWNGRAVRIPINPYCDGNALANFITSEEIQALVVRILNGARWEWNGSNNVGHINEDAEAAVAELELAAQDIELSEEQED